MRIWYSVLFNTVGRRGSISGASHISSDKAELELLQVAVIEVTSQEPVVRMAARQEAAEICAGEQRQQTEGTLKFMIDMEDLIKTDE